jgi:lipid-A-disaccharide synthase
MSPEKIISRGGNPANRPPDSKKIMIVAGEQSGDLHGSNLVRAMHRIDPDLRFYGIGGRKMREAGVELIADAADMAVVGLTEVVGKLGMILGVMRRMKLALKKLKPALLILIDYPDFNLRLGKAAKKNGVRVFYYISPQIWAWRKGRIHKIREIVDKMAVILPFEEQVYRQVSMDVSFVGHPLLDVVKTKYARQEALRKFDLQDGITTVGLLPGSRKGEVSKLLPVMLKAAGILMQSRPPVQFILPLADALDRDFVEEMIRQESVPVRVVPNEIYDVIGVSDIVVVASGTATLETALLGTPMVIIYKVSPLSYYVGTKVINVTHIGLANLIAGKTIVPELIQDDANPNRIAAEVIGILADESRMQRIKEELNQIREKLGSPGASEKAARLACDML